MTATGKRVSAITDDEMKTAVGCNCDEYPECTHVLYFFAGVRYAELAALAESGAGPAQLICTCFAGGYDAHLSDCPMYAQPPAAANEEPVRKICGPDSNPPSQQPLANAFDARAWSQGKARSYLYGVMGYLGISRMTDEAVNSIAARMADDVEKLLAGSASGAQRVTPEMMSEVFAKSVHRTTSPLEDDHIYDHRIAADLLNKKLAAPAGHTLSEEQVANAIFRVGGNAAKLATELNALLRASQAGYKEDANAK